MYVTVTFVHDKQLSSAYHKDSHVWDKYLLYMQYAIDLYTIEKILAKFKLGDCIAIHQLTKFSSSPIFALIRYITAGANYLCKCLESKLV